MTIRPSQRPTIQTKQRAKELRKNPTTAEKILWSVLRERNVGGLKFRRQHPIEPYIVDFYCAKANLIVEVDGPSHDEQVEYDARRDNLLQKLGVTILRISNEDVMENLEGVCEMILKTAHNNLGKSIPEA